jgi:hypothetical protein
MEGRGPGTQSNHSGFIFVVLSTPMLECLLVSVGLALDCQSVMEGGEGGAIVFVRFRRDQVCALFGLGRSFGRLMKCGRGLRTSGGTGLPFDDGVPVLKFFFVEFFLPFRFWIFAVFANVSSFMAAHAVAAFNVVIKLTLRVRGDFVAVDEGFQVGLLETGR